ncbi:hypothetical protein EV122DRAFT_283629 [Schizophyllum commune]
MSALRVAGVLSAQLKPGLTAIKNAKDVVTTCACGNMAEGYAKPCRQPVCMVCVKNMCSECKAPYSMPNALCPHHRGPRCPHEYCTNGRVVEMYQADPKNGADLFRVVSAHGARIEELLDDLIALTKDM